ncbi:TonB family protein [Asticcacaulis sp. MM231]|uniref:TonB family protein n=1 Tax=Asticcacaulis sp. MM231 TaxID=3157666 RepID=UPI0032D59151
MVFSVLVAVTLHALPVAVALWWGLYPPIPLTVDEPAVAVEIVTLQAPPEPPSERPDGKRQVESLASRAEPRPVERVLPEMFPTDVEPLMVPPPTPRPATAIAAAPAPENTAPAAKPAPPAPLAATTPQTWHTQLLSHIERHKRYPTAARGRQGVVQVRFSMDREGRVLSSAVSRSSGSGALDRAALDTLKRASPLPKPPADIPGNPIELAFDIEFFTR